MKDKIEQAAKEYCEKEIPSLKSMHFTISSAFEAGAEWALANQWHEINKELPKETENVLVLYERQIPIIGKVDSEIIKELNITHWCEIPQFKEK